MSSWSYGRVALLALFCACTAPDYPAPADMHQAPLAGVEAARAEGASPLNPQPAETLAGMPETPSGMTPVPEESAPPANPPPPPGDGVEEVASNAGNFLVRFRPAPAPVPENEPFGLEVWVLEPGPEPRLAAGVELAVDAGMPEHGHGMNREPKVKRLGPGHFAVTGMLFHMPGDWELYFDITRGALTERAQVGLSLD
jgi:hypothetical protein